MILIRPLVDGLKLLQFSLRYYRYNITRRASVHFVMNSTVEKLEQERLRLESKVNELVEALESTKSDTQIKVPKEAIIKSREEREASLALEQLELKDEEASEKKPDSTIKKAAPTKTASETKNQSKGPGKTKADSAVDKPVDISRLDLRIGKIVDVNKHPDADSLYVEKIDCGDSTGPRTVISGLVNHVPIEEMRDRLVVVFCNLKPVKMRGILSEGMVMCASTPDKVEILQPPSGVKPGDRVVFDKFPGEPDAQLNPKKKIWETISPDVKTNDQGIAVYKDCEFKIDGNDGKFTSTLLNVNIR